MRRGNRSEFLFEDGVLIGINLGADHTAEHEFGIASLKADFGFTGVSHLKFGFGKDKALVDRKRVGVTARTITHGGENVILGKVGVRTMLIYNGRNGRHYYEQDGKDWFKTWTDNELHLSKAYKYGSYESEAQIMAAAWSDRTFGIHVNTKEGRGYLKELHQAFLDNDIAFLFAGHGTPFSNPGLCLCIASRLPESVDVTLSAADIDTLELAAAKEDTGIEKVLEDAGCRFFALSPSWMPTKGNLKKESAHPVMFWLNPREQQSNNHGWYSVEELEQWAEGKGPIPKEVSTD